MSDKSWKFYDDPGSKLCAEVASNLIDRLSGKISWIGYEISANKNNDAPAIKIYLNDDRNVKEIPITCEGYEVMFYIVGKGS